MSKYKSFNNEDLFIFFTEEPLLSHFFTKTIIHEDETLPHPIGINIQEGAIHLFCNPKTLGEFTQAQKIGALVHEYLHILNLHIQRANFNGVNHSERYILNYAMDLSINPSIKKVFDLPDWVLMPNSEPYYFPENLTFEDYYFLLKEKCEEQGQQGGEGQQGQQGGEGLLDDHSLWENSSSSDEIKTIVRDIAKEYTDMGKTNEGATIGNMAGGILQKLVSIETHEFSWQSVARRFLSSVISPKKTITYKRFSRRYGFPNSGRKLKVVAKVAAIVDTSASMSETFLAHVGGQLNLMTKAMQIDVLWCDTEVKGVVKKFRPKGVIEVAGRGGTDMQPAFDLANSDGYKGIVCFTDGELYLNFKNKIPTLWVVINNKSFKAPEGDKVAHVEWRK